MCQNLRPVLLPREPPLRPKLPEDDDREELRELPDEEPKPPDGRVLLPEDEERPPNRPPREPSPLSVPELRGVPAAGLCGAGGVTPRPAGLCGSGGVLRVFPPQYPPPRAGRGGTLPRVFMPGPPNPPNRFCAGGGGVRRTLLRRLPEPTMKRTTSSRMMTIRKVPIPKPPSPAVVVTGALTAPVPVCCCEATESVFPRSVATRLQTAS